MCIVKCLSCFAISWCLIVLEIAVVFPGWVLAAELPEERHPASSASLQAIISDLKASDRGPFSGIRWFCKDGTVQPARGAGCARHGGGIQHGELKEEVQELRSNGFRVVTIYAELSDADLQSFLAYPRELAEPLLERFLVGYDDGWIYSGARYYRGAAQVEDEIEGARLLLQSIAGDRRWRSEHFLLLREAIRLLPNTRAAPELAEVRARSKRLASSDSGFVRLKNKIHSYPDAADAERVYDYANSRKGQRHRSDYRALAELIDKAYHPPAPGVRFKRAALEFQQRELRELLLRAAGDLQHVRSVPEEFARLSELMHDIRSVMPNVRSPIDAATLLSVSLEAEHYLLTLRDPLLTRLKNSSRLEHLKMLEAVNKAAYGSGLLSERAFRAAMASILSLERDTVTVGQYADELRWLGRLAGLAAGSLQWEFGAAVEKWQGMEPKVLEYAPDRLRASPLLVGSEILSTLSLDADQLQGLEHMYLGRRVSSNRLTALNPGLAHGVLIDPSRSGRSSIDPAESIYLVPQTVAELPRVAGILTKDEGNLVSHVQLLARNLGIPNVVVDGEVLPWLQPWYGRSLFVAASPGGRVEIAPYDPKRHPVFGPGQAQNELRIDPDLDKLKLDYSQFTTLTELRAKDSGRIAGPKAAKLGELKHRFPGSVSEGVVLPFGFFRQILNQRLPEGVTLFDWMKAKYREIDRLRSAPLRRKQLTSEVLARIRATIESTRFSPQFRQALYQKLRQEFGPDGSYGVFVRSDTNIEDLPNFSGAGLNKTVPNVVGFDQILAAIRTVFASPFTERAFAWRQDFMSRPEDVYVSVLLQRTVPVERSGVLITSNILTGNPNYLTIAANEGVGGVVNNQNAEVVLVDLKTGTVLPLSEASESEKKVVSRYGGIEKRRVSDSRRVLSPTQLKTLITFSEDLYQRFPELKVDDHYLPADVEFGFIGDGLALFQIRPFIESQAAKQNEYLRQLDKSLQPNRALPVALHAPPRRAR